MLVELRVGEQRYRVVWEVLEGASVTEVARRLGVPPSFRTADRLRSIPERRGIHVSETSEVFAGVS